MLLALLLLQLLGDSLNQAAAYALCGSCCSKGAVGPVIHWFCCKGP
jgi:hypothetical protein